MNHYFFSWRINWDTMDIPMVFPWILPFFHDDLLLSWNSLTTRPKWRNLEQRWRPLAGNHSGNPGGLETSRSLRGSFMDTLEYMGSDIFQHLNISEIFPKNHTYIYWYCNPLSLGIWFSWFILIWQINVVLYKWIIIDYREHRPTMAAGQAVEAHKWGSPLNQRTHPVKKNQLRYRRNW